MVVSHSLLILILSYRGCRFLQGALYQICVIVYALALAIKRDSKNRKHLKE